MNFGEKLFKLRKEKGMSQENLAEQIGTTRQAISKWENNQGFPEVEKLLQLLNVFEVSVDYLLKDDKTINCSNEKGYYVSKELAKGYIANEKKISFLISLSFMFLAFTGIPYIISPNDESITHLGMAICVVLGIGLMVLMEDEVFNGISIEAKVLYVYMLNRMDLSYKNNWIDEDE